jgi:hypothetical protein
MADATIYEHANFQGRSQVFTKGRYDDALKQQSIGNVRPSIAGIEPAIDGPHIAAPVRRTSNQQP